MMRESVGAFPNEFSSSSPSGQPSSVGDLPAALFTRDDREHQIETIGEEVAVAVRIGVRPRPGLSSGSDRCRDLPARLLGKWPAGSKMEVPGIITK
jgi:hypothetical protein